VFEWFALRFILVAEKKLSAKAMYLVAKRQLNFHSFARSASIPPSEMLQLQLEGLGGMLRREPEGGAVWPHRDSTFLVSFQVVASFIGSLSLGWM
jgi:hypothetical protein